MLFICPVAVLVIIGLFCIFPDFMFGIKEFMQKKAGVTE